MSCKSITFSIPSGRAIVKLLKYIYNLTRSFEGHIYLIFGCILVLSQKPGRHVMVEIEYL